jgi:dTDP-4-dehydrorhamnose reductase
MFGTAVESVCRDKNMECLGLTHKDLEITRPDELRSSVEEYKPDIIINSVAISSIDACELDPQKAFDVNSVAVLNLAKVCKANNAILVQVSTQAVFDGTKKNGFYTENSQPNPTNIYAASKYSAECFVKNICPKYYIVRLPTLFGKRRNKNTAFVDKILNGIKEGRGLKISDDKVDTFGYTNDLAELLISILKKAMPFGVYHLTNSGKASYYEFVLELIRLLKADIKLYRAKHRDFARPLFIYKPLRTPAKSIKLEPIRNWKKALREYLREINQEMDNV